MKVIISWLYLVIFILKSVSPLYSLTQLAVQTPTQPPSEDPRELYALATFIQS